jgi:hypothetical protein
MEILVEKDPFKLIRKRPEMYWGPTGPSVHNLISNIVEQLVILECKEIHVLSHDKWHIVGANADWFSPVIPEGKTINYIFTHMLPFLEVGVAGAPRNELFVYDFSESVVAWHKTESILIKGSAESTPLNELFLKYFGSGSAVAFTGNTYA